MKNISKLKPFVVCSAPFVPVGDDTLNAGLGSEWMRLLGEAKNDGVFERRGRR